MGKRGRIVGLLLLLLLLTGCSIAGRSEKKQENTAEKRIAVLGREDYVYADENFVKGMEMALKEQSGSEQITWKHYDDQGDYDRGLLLAQQLSQDDSVIAVFSFQDFEVIEAEMSYFESAKKPLFAVQGCYESALNKHAEYLYSSYLSSQDMGIAMAKYCAKQGKKEIVCSHTLTTFETEEMRGFVNTAQNLDLHVMDMMQGPDNITDLQVVYEKWKALGIDTLYICRYTDNVEQKEWIFKMIQYIKQKDPDFLILGDYSLDGASYLEQYGKYMDGTAFPNPYSVKDSNKALDFAKRYAQETGAKGEISNIAYQGYDMTGMLLWAYESAKGGDMTEYLKSEAGYDGVSGTICYSPEGKIMTSTEYRVVQNGKFQ